MKNDSTENEILKAAKEIFHLKGMEGTRMQEIADKANINKAMLHYYYKNKEVLFNAVFKSAFNMLAPQLNTILNDESDLFTKIQNFTSSYISFVIEHPYIPNFVIQEINRNPEFIIKLKTQENFPSLSKFKIQVEEAIENKVIKPISAESLFINIMSLNIFPFIGRPLLSALINVEESDYDQLLQNRKKEVASFIINSITK